MRRPLAQATPWMQLFRGEKTGRTQRRMSRDCARSAEHQRIVVEPQLRRAPGARQAGELKRPAAI